MSKDLMIDIESLSLKKNAAIISMGYLIFDSEKETKFKHEVLTVIDQCENFNGRDVNWDTIKFHLGLTQETHQYLMTDFSVLLKQALINLSDYIKKHKPKRVWANGICFDISVLENCYEQYELEIPWKYNQVSDARTLYKAYPLHPMGWAEAKSKVKGDAHNPLYDSRVQAHLVREALL